MGITINIDLDDLFVTRRLEFFPCSSGFCSRLLMLLKATSMVSLSI